MLESLQHRGPDSEGIHAGPLGVIGARRLRILGLEPASDQPFKSPDSECIAVFNGEIFNYIELREELRGLGHQFVSSGDTEVVVHAYEEWDAACLSRFNGMFALVIVDADRGRLFFARDRFGVKPFYYARRGSLFVFASEPIALLASGFVTPRVNRHAVTDYLQFGVTDHTRSTFFEEITQLPAGHMGTIQDGEFSTSEWYNLVDSTGPVPWPMSDDDRTRKFGELLQESVRLRLRSDVPVSLLLSGGLDSSSIASVARGLPNSANLTAYVVGFPGTPWDETKYASLVARHASMPLVTENASFPSEEDLRRCIREQGEPFASPSILAQWLVMRAIARHATRVVLSGQGADEVLAGYAYFDALAIRSFLRQRRFGEAFQHLFHPTNSRRILEILAGLFILAAPLVPWRAIWRAPWLHGAKCTPQSCTYLRDLISMRGLREALIFHVTRRLPQLLRYEDRNSMAFSVESRHPFLDHRIVEFVLRSPDGVAIGLGVRKRVLRQSMEHVLPPEITTRRDKVGFQTPFQWLSSTQFRSAFVRLASNPPDELRGFIDFERAIRLSKKVRRRRPHNTLWRLFNLLLWYKEVVDPIREQTPARLLQKRNVVP